MPRGRREPASPACAGPAAAPPPAGEVRTAAVRLLDGSTGGEQCLVPRPDVLQREVGMRRRRKSRASSGNEQERSVVPSQRAGRGEQRLAGGERIGVGKRMAPAKYRRSGGRRRILGNDEERLAAVAHAFVQL